jgi:hypothetical protein
VRDLHEANPSVPVLVLTHLQRIAMTLTRAHMDARTVGRTLPVSVMHQRYNVGHSH